MTHTMQIIHHQLQTMGLPTAPHDIHLIREKFGITVFRVFANNESYVGKYYEETHDRLEIEYYHVLNSINVPTIKVIGHTDCLLLLEDISASSIYRLGTEEDMADPKVAGLLAKWYKQLHTKGRNYAGLSKLYCVAEDELTKANLENAAAKTNSTENPIWQLLQENLETYRNAYTTLSNTIVYNDFYWDNFIVAKDYTSAMMFDYNCMWRMYAYADIHNVLKNLPHRAGEASMESYGTYNPMEKLYEDAFIPLSGLITACNMESFPPWTNDIISMLHSGELKQLFDKLHI